MVALEGTYVRCHLHRRRDTTDYDFAELDELAHAYAVTIHRSQGSEYPAVVIPLTTSSWMMLQRNLLHTGLTRGIPQEMEAAVREDYDAVFGARGTTSVVDRNRVLGKRILALVANFVSSRPIRDINCGLRVFRRELLEAYLPLLPDGFSASSTTTLLFLHRNRHVAFHPVVTAERTGKSTVKQVRDGVKALGSKAVDAFWGPEPWGARAEALFPRLALDSFERHVIGFTRFGPGHVRSGRPQPSLNLRLRTFRTR